MKRGTFVAMLLVLASIVSAGTLSFTNLPSNTTILVGSTRTLNATINCAGTCANQTNPVTLSIQQQTPTKLTGAMTATTKAEKEGYAGIMLILLVALIILVLHLKHPKTTKSVILVVIFLAFAASTLILEKTNNVTGLGTLSLPIDTSGEVNVTSFPAQASFNLTCNQPTTATYTILATPQDNNTNITESEPFTISCLSTCQTELQPFTIAAIVNLNNCATGNQNCKCGATTCPVNPTSDNVQTELNHLVLEQSPKCNI